MTEKDMMKIIKENNINGDIKWKIVSNTKERIVIENDYGAPGEVRFELLMVNEDGTNLGIKMIDKLMDYMYGYRLQGSDRWSDYTHLDDGIAQAVRATVGHFYHCY